MFQSEREKVKRSIVDVLNAPKSLVSIDVNDVRDLFQEGGVIHAFNASVDASMENRMILMMAKIMKHAECFEPYNHALVFFFRCLTSQNVRYFVFLFGDSTFY